MSKLLLVAVASLLPVEEIDCESDPQAGVKYMWSFGYQWRGAGAKAHFFYSYWDRGEQLPLFYRGTAGGVMLSHRPEKKYLDEYDGDIFRGEKRKAASGPEVEAPFDARGIMLLTYRYKSSDGPRSQAKNDDTWVYIPSLRRVRRISSAQRTDAVAGTDFTMDDLFSFNGIIPQYEWECLGERKLVGPMNTRVKGYPYEESHNFGPYGLSFANDRWEEVQELRDLVIVSDIIVNVQTGTGNRIEFWDRTGTPMKSKGRIRRFIDVGRLTKGR